MSKFFGTVKRMGIVFMVALVPVMAAGCASGQKTITVAGHVMPFIRVSSPAEIDKRMAEDGVLTMKEFGAMRDAGAERKSDLSGAAKAALVTVDASLWGLQYIGVLGSMSAAGNVALGFFSISDLISAYGNWIEKKNAVYASLKFSRPLEYSRTRDGETEGFMEYLGTEDTRRNFREKAASCKWRVGIIPIRKSGNGACYYAGIGNDSFTLQEFLYMVKYSEKAKSRPESHPCSIKEAELFLKDQVDLILGNKR